MFVVSPSGYGRAGRGVIRRLYAGYTRVIRRLSAPPQTADVRAERGAVTPGPRSGAADRGGRCDATPVGRMEGRVTCFVWGLDGRRSSLQGALAEWQHSELASMRKRVWARRLRSWEARMWLVTALGVVYVFGKVVCETILCMPPCRNT